MVPITLNCTHICKVYQTRSKVVSALQDVTFSVEEQEFVCIIGPSGCGKTTLLKLIAGLLQLTSGQIAFSTESADRQPRTAMVFQEHSLFPWMTVLDNIAFGLETQGVGWRERCCQVLAFIEKVGLADFAHSYPHELSGGMRQRVAIARALLADPQILLMDEPFGSLDAQTRLVLQEELLRIWKNHRKTVIYVTHDIEEAVLLGDRVLVMTSRPGRIRQEIPIYLSRPRNLLAREQSDIKEVKWHIWEILKDEVHKDLHIPA